MDFEQLIDKQIDERKQGEALNIPLQVLLRMVGKTRMECGSVRS